MYCLFVARKVFGNFVDCVGGVLGNRGEKGFLRRLLSEEFKGGFSVEIQRLSLVRQVRVKSRRVTMT